MAAENEDDPEGFLLAESRKIVGERVPIVASFDLHGVLTDRMLQHADAIVIYHTYPHVDFFETGQRAARLLVRLMNGEVRCWDGAGYSPTNPDDLLGSSFDFTEKNGQFSYGPFHSIDLGHH